MRSYTYLLSALAAVMMTAIFAGAAENHPPTYKFCQPKQKQTMTLLKGTGTFVLRRPQYVKEKFKFDTCSFELRTGPAPVVLKYHFSEFHTRPDPHCNNTYLCLGGIHHCGVWSPIVKYRRLIPENSALTIVLKANWTIQCEPMEVSLLVESVPTHGVVKVPFGHGSSESSIYYKRLTYSAGMNYIDDCAVSHEEPPIATTLKPIETTGGPHETEPDSTTTHPVTAPSPEPTNQSISTTDGPTSTMAFRDFKVKCICQCECPIISEPCTHNQTLFEPENSTSTFTAQKK